MERYTVFDVETPNMRCDRMSAIGIAVVEDGEIRKEFYSLIDPETWFDAFNVRLTGISEYTVRDAPSFRELWPEMEPLLSEGILVAHNAVFDLSVLKKCLLAYGIDWKDSVDYLCTVRMGRKLLPGISHSLDTLCCYYGIGLTHHHAMSDCRGCAGILLRYMEDGADVKPFIRKYRLTLPEGTK